MTIQKATLQNPLFICPQEILDRQVLLPIEFYSFTGEKCRGHILLDKILQADIQKLFQLMVKTRFPIQSVIPIAHPTFQWDDERSMEANNTSAFNYRCISGTSRLSNHATGKALDINPLQNPFIMNGIISPKNAIYDMGSPGTLTENSDIVQFLKHNGWTWGGDWSDRKDYQHFEKV